ncbi:hypothetical protein M501DRAFT_1000451 [Patellaria atrata CBS 101060]|uniref:LCCL domain-containing protein n=1 Tax=Patellaria atrata CBS 101060 TaxID=1346257 RepID=A0A9P4SF70_9PEZI|nr:hypothetical protein M501DRAFT_1000451 [Patellaria atrata CBS 101060]
MPAGTASQHSLRSLPEYRDEAGSSDGSDETAIDAETADLIRPDGADEDEATTRTSALLNKYIPPRAKRAWKSTVKWMKGPQPPRPYRIRPYFPAIQEAPIRLLERYAPKRKHKILILVALYFCWLLSFSLVLHKSAFASDVPGYGSPVRIGCTARYWRDGNGCGINGNQCRPFANNTLTFRCPANCKRVEVVNPHAVGGRSVNYRSLVIGGPTDEEDSMSSGIYRGDSFICGSAIHAGMVRNKDGGCGVLEFKGEQQNFPSKKKNGIRSISFDSYFPHTFGFVEGTASQCKDLRWPLLAVSLTFTVLLSLFTTFPAVFFVTEFTAIFFHVALASDPPELTNYYSLISLALGRFLPAAFCAAAFYRYCVHYPLTGLTAQIEKTILWLGGCWVGALNNYTFDKIPIQRLTPHDIKQEPGAIPALIIVVLSIFCIALGQAWALRIEGRLPKYLAIYGIMCISLLLLVAIPKMNVRIHHYILALLLLPGTAIQNRPSLLFQGLLVGLFINGIARWGFDSILQTPAELRGDARLGTPLPTILPPIIHNNIGTTMAPNITFEWDKPFPHGWDGISVLVNDVERFRGYEDAPVDSFTWIREHEGLPEYFRFAFMRGSRSGDFSKAATWYADGGYAHQKPGPSF